MHTLPGFIARDSILHAYNVPRRESRISTILAPKLGKLGEEKSGKILSNGRADVLSTRYGRLVSTVWAPRDDLIISPTSHVFERRNRYVTCLVRTHQITILHLHLSLLLGHMTHLVHPLVCRCAHARCNTHAHERTHARLTIAMPIATRYQSFRGSEIGAQLGCASKASARRVMTPLARRWP